MFEVLRRARLLPALLLTAALMGQLAIPALASTVSTISGTVTDSTNGAPLAAVAVIARSASGTYHAKTNARGFYSMTGLPTDEYVVSFEINNYQPLSIAGVTAFADEIATVNAAMVRSLKTIATVNAAAGGGAFQPNNPSDTYSVNAQQINNINGSSFNLSEGNLLRALPGVSYSVGQIPTIRGGRTDMVDYEFEGMPYTDPYLNKYINDLKFPGFGLSMVQLSPGTEDSSFGNSGDGTVNVIARQGAYKGGFEAGIAVGGGAGFEHDLNLGWSFGTPDNRLTDYASYTAQNGAPQYGGKYANLSANIIGLSTFNTNAVALTQDREFTNNLVYRFGRNNKYSVQYFVDTSYHRAAGGYGINLADACYATDAPPPGGTENCNGAWPFFVGNNYPSGLGGPPGVGGYAQTGITSAEYQELLTLQPGQTPNALNETLAQAGRPPYQEFYNGSGSKVQLNDHLSSSTYAFVSYFNTLGQDISDQVCCGDSQSIFRNQGGWTNGANIGLTTQISDKNLLKIGAVYTNLNPHNEGLFNTDLMFNTTVYGDNAWEIYDFIPQGQFCPIATPTNADPCGYLYNYVKNVSQLQLPAGGSAAVLTSNGIGAYVTDSWQPSDKLHIDAGLRLDTMNYNLPPQGVLADCTTRYFPIYVQQPDPSGLINGKAVGPGNCPTMLFAPISSAQSNPHIVQPRLAFAYEATKHDAVRASYGRTVRFIHGQEMDYTAPPNYGSEFAGIPAFLNPAIAYWAGATSVTGNPNPVGGSGGICSSGINCLAPSNYQNPTYASVPVECGYVNYGAAVPCANYQEQLYWAEINDDFAFPITPLKPVTTNNFDLSWEHAFSHGWSARVTPWSRRTYDLDVNLPIYAANAQGQTIVNPATGLAEKIGPTAVSNDGLEIAKGLEFILQKESPYGFSGSLTVDSTSVRQNVYPANSDEFHGIIQQNVQAFPTLTYRVPYVAPFTSALNLSYATHNGWRFATTLFYTGGYPYGPGENEPFTVAGAPHIIANTNTVNGAGSTGQFVDPSNPGSLLAPNIAATLGTPDGTYPDGVLTHPDLNGMVTVEKTLGAGKLGFEIFNVFDDPYPGPTYPLTTFGNAGPYGLGGSLYEFGSFGLNPSYQPVATGVSGPLTGSNGVCTSTPTACNAVGNGPYTHYPNGQGINFFVYYSLKL